VHDLMVIGDITITGANLYAGGVAGASTPTAMVSNVASRVNVTASGSGDVNAGGVLGASQGAVSNVFAIGAISATTTGSSSVYAGGIAGAISPSGSIIYAYATGAVSATGTGQGTYAQDGDNSNTIVGASGIVGGNSTAPVRYTVALNSSVSAAGDSYKKLSFRISSGNNGKVITNGAANYGKADLTPTGSSSTSGSPDKGAVEQDGLDILVTGGPLPAPLTAPDETWWRSTGWVGSDWTTVWQWDPATGLPKLR